MSDRGLQQLTSWKEIADYLGVSLRTAQSWERDKGLPVQRMSGEKGRVLADPAELDKWRRSAVRTNSWWSNPTYLRSIALASVALLVAVFLFEVWIYFWRHKGLQPASFRLGHRSITVLDSNGADLWRRGFTEPLESADYSDAAMGSHRKIAFNDIDSDGDVETLFVYSPLNSLRNPSALFCFSRKGEERWSFAPVRTNGGVGFGRTHVINDMLVAQPHGKGEAQILLLDCQLPGHSAKLFLLSPRGEIQATFAHEGHLGLLETADVDGCGRDEILMGGFAAERHEAEVIILAMPPDNVAGSNELGDVTRTPQPVKLQEKAVLTFPRTCVNKKLAESNRIAHIADSGDVLTVVVSELSEDPSVEVTYQLDRQLRVKDIWFSDALRNLHQTLRAQGVLDHSLTEAEVSSLKNINRLPSHADTFKTE